MKRRKAANWFNGVGFFAGPACRNAQVRVTEGFGAIFEGAQKGGLMVAYWAKKGVTRSLRNVYVAVKKRPVAPRVDVATGHPIGGKERPNTKTPPLN